jgi:ubiquinone/menaquinone biosynthesis C-methylase UbiE
MIFEYENAEDWWNERCKQYGHTGYRNRILYAYDQPLRVRAVKKALSDLAIRLGPPTRILDVGCGVGTFLLEFSSKGARVTGIDISSEAIREARQRMPNKGIKLLRMKAEDIDFPENSFDLAISITVLEHITNSRELLKAIKNIIRVARQVLILEASTTIPAGKDSLYMVFRTRKDWIDLFERNGCELVYEKPLPQVGFRILRYYANAISYVDSRIRLKKIIGKKVIMPTTREMGNLPRFESIARVMMLYLLRLIDYLLLYLSFPAASTDFRIMVFKKLATIEA